METQTMNKRIDMHGILPDSQKLHTYLKIRIYSDLDRCAQHIKRPESCQKNIYTIKINFTGKLSWPAFKQNWWVGVCVLEKWQRIKVLSTSYVTRIRLTLISSKPSNTAQILKGSIGKMKSQRQKCFVSIIFLRMVSIIFLRRVPFQSLVSCVNVTSSMYL